MENKEKFINKWEKTRRKRKRSYVLVSGLLMCSAMLIGGIIGKLIAPQSILHEKYWFIYLGCLVGGLTGGLSGATARWDRNEEKYKDLTNDRQDVK